MLITPHEQDYAGFHDSLLLTDQEYSEYEHHDAVHELLIGATDSSPEQNPTSPTTMLYTIAIVLLVLWAVGLASAYTLGGFIHILLVIAVAVFLIQIIQGRKLG